MSVILRPRAAGNTAQSMGIRLRTGRGIAMLVVCAALVFATVLAATIPVRAERTSIPTVTADALLGNLDR